jgi:DNA (cytosine-5)-methyltransferase 1
MKYLSVCSGIEAATVAWHHLGWKPVGFAEIEKFPQQVLAHHYPDVPNFQDLTQHDKWPLERGAVDLLVGGTPCQAFSIAGLRRGMDDERGQLTLEFVRLAARLRPRWIVWENVPGVLSSGGGRDFGSFLGALAQLGYGFAYRVLDAQYFGVAQRRRRVFVVGYLGDWRCAAAVLFERESLRGNPPPRREAWEGSARSTAASLTSSGRGVARSGESRGQDDVVIGTITARMFNALGARDIESGALLAVASGRQHAAKWPAEIACTLNARYGDKQGLEDQHALGGASLFVPAVGTDCYNGSVTGDVAATMGTPGSSVNASGPTVMVAQPIGFNARQDPVQYGDQAGALDQDGFTMAVAQPIGLDEEQNARVDGFGTLKARMEGGGFEGSVMTPAMQVRRLTPVECERLQGFPDGYTDIRPRGKDTPDGPRYKALGNSMAVPVMRWIGERVNLVDSLKRSR